MDGPAAQPGCRLQRREELKVISRTVIESIPETAFKGDSARLNLLAHRIGGKFAVLAPLAGNPAISPEEGQDYPHFRCVGKKAGPLDSPTKLFKAPALIQLYADKYRLIM